MGNKIDPSVFNGKQRLTDYGKSNIVGMQGLIWSENLRGAETIEYMVFPKLLGLAERAWSPAPSWETEKTPPLLKANTRPPGPTLPTNSANGSSPDSIFSPAAFTTAFQLRAPWYATACYTPICNFLASISAILLMVLNPGCKVRCTPARWP
ncbi:MAG: family 20 glycosylhydrolase [Saprospiraceae bacterium]|nr:family 20 glycosylhydrolase [Saprospiraceae bacterium]